jgi:hypothetical protein
VRAWQIYRKHEDAVRRAVRENNRSCHSAILPVSKLERLLSR